LTRSGKITASTTGVGYRTTVMNSAPGTYWRLDETTGTLAADNTGHGNSGTYSGALNRGVTGVVASNKGIHLGPTGHVFSNASALAAPTRFSVGVWVKTTTTRGGRILGFGNSQAGTSTAYDRQLYMLNSGQLIFGTFKSAVNFLWSPKSYNDGTRHYVVVELDPTSGMRMYVDSVLVAFNGSVKAGASYNGWWRLGADNLTSWPLRPASNGIAADIDEYVLYGTLLSGTQMRTQMTSE
jgi:hypothetical protein